jgi:hypothetical protein
MEPCDITEAGPGFSRTSNPADTSIPSVCHRPEHCLNMSMLCGSAGQHAGFIDTLQRMSQSLCSFLCTC